MIVWSLFAVGAVYVWATVPLMAASAVLATLARFQPRPSRETRTLDWMLIASVAAAAAQLVPLSPALRAAVSPHAEAISSAIRLGPPDPAAWQPLSLAPGSTEYSIALVLTALVVFWAARRSCSRGLALQIARYVAIAGMFAALSAFAFRAGGDRSLIYGRWHALDAGAHPFGPFVNRNHFATWLLLACPLAAGYVAATLRPRRLTTSAAARLVDAFEWLGTGAGWVGIAGIVMILALVASTSRSGLVALTFSVAGSVWLARRRITRRAGLFGLFALLAVGAAVGAYVGVTPVLSRVDETLRIGAGARPRIWQETLRIIRDFPLTGTGLGGYQTAMLVYQQTGWPVFINQAHNQYLHLFAEGGFLVGIPVALAVAAFIRLFCDRLAQDTSSSAWLRIGAGAAICAVALQGFWETGLRIPANGLLFAAAAAVAVHRPPR